MQSKRLKLDLETTDKMSLDEPIVDESLESRSMLVYGVESMKKMKSASVLLSGLGVLGVEIAKNIALAGVRRLVLHDTKVTTAADVGVQFYLGESDVGRNRADASLAKVAELNPAVKLHASQVDLIGNDCAALNEFNCVILTETNLAVQQRLNEHCRARGIAFLAADVRGVFCWSFTDLGDSFVVLDKNGEDPPEVMIESITKANPGVVTTLANTRHNLETGDYVKFNELEGMSALNGNERPVTVISPFAFSIGDTSALGAHTGRGVFVQVKKPQTMQFESLATQLRKPKILIADYAKESNATGMHIALQALAQFQSQNDDKLPAAWSGDDATKVLSMATSIARAAGCTGEFVSASERLWRAMSYTACAPLPPLECLKSLSGKFTPIQQWLLVDAIELLPTSFAELDALRRAHAPQGARTDAMRVCVGERLVHALARAQLFMIGVGAIGCEMLKNFATMGVATEAPGMITATDPDVVEKSNLNRQFLFRSADIGQTKAQSAAAAVKRINAQLRITADLNKVGAETEHIYNNAFFKKQDVVVNALDNVAARLYVDARCVLNQRALLESGTLGAKGHVQCIVPYLTESYASSRDPPEQDVPFCTLKSFPSKLEHVIEWARDFSFGGAFVSKPEMVNRLMQEPNLLARLQQPHAGGIEGGTLRSVAKALARRPRTFADCVQRARQVFESHYRRKALSLLHTYPPDKTTDALGTLFWAPPKRAPKPIEFDWNDALHRQYVVHFAALLARTWCIDLRAPENAAWHADNVNVANAVCARATVGASPLPLAAAAAVAALDSKQIATIEAMYAEQVKAAPIEPWVPKTKTVVTDESLSKEAALKKEQENNANPDDFEAQVAEWAKTVRACLSRAPITQPLDVASFEKDDDSNHHVDYIAAAANLRARLYGIVEGDRLKIKGIAGRIMPAIATTTSCVAGLVAIEMMKYLQQQLPNTDASAATAGAGVASTSTASTASTSSALAIYKNAFFNLAISFYTFSEPQQAEKKKISNELSITLWDSWEVRDAQTLEQLIDYFDRRFNLVVTGITHGAMMIYMKFLPQHQKRKKQTVRELCKLDDGIKYVDLTIAFQEKVSGNKVEGPAVRFWF